MPATPPTIYVPPSQSDVMHFSREVCAELASRTGDASFTDQQIIFGLSAFLRTCGMLLADQLNGQSPSLASD